MQGGRMNYSAAAERCGSVGKSLVASGYRLPIRKGSLLGGWSCLRQGLSGGRLLLGVLGVLRLFVSVCAAGLHKCTAAF